MGSPKKTSRRPETLLEQTPPPKLRKKEKTRPKAVKGASRASRGPDARPPNKMGQPTKFTEEMKGKILTAIRAGNHPLTAALYAGISHQTWYNWKKRAELDELEYVDFFEDVQRAEAISEVSDLAIIGRAAMGSPAEYKTNAAGELVMDEVTKKPIQLKPAVSPLWTAAAWRLERKAPERFGRRFEHEVKGTGPKGEIVHRHDVVDWSKVSTEDLRTLKRIARAALPKELVSGEEEAIDVVPITIQEEDIGKEEGDADETGHRRR